MPNQLLTATGIILIVILCLVSYAPLKARLSLEDFQSLPYGSAFSAFLPAFLVAFAALSSLMLIYVGSQTGANQH
jgi:hypothetical protein